MIRIRKAIVDEVLQNGRNTAVVLLSYDGKKERAVNYCRLTGDIGKGDTVYANTSATFMRLGSGGMDFVILNETRGGRLDMKEEGRIMKMRYTPFQFNCKCPSEEDSSYRKCVDEFESLGGMPVLIGELHSMLSPAACCLKYLDDGLRITYIMTDGGCLPIDFSSSVRELLDKGIISNTITYGNAFGGDIEAVNIYDALVYASSVTKCDIAIITMGPGIIGTGTRYGFSGIEQGNIIDSVNKLHGTPVVIPRISFKDPRERHLGISHHTLTVLSGITYSSAYVVLPEIDGEDGEYIRSQVMSYGIDRKHHVYYQNSEILYNAIQKFKVVCSTMGRGMNDDKEFFMSVGAASEFTYRLLKNNST